MDYTMIEETTFIEPKKINRVFHEKISFPTTYKKKKSGKSEKNADDSALVAPPGIEPGSKVPETFILSIELGSQLQSESGVW